MAQDVEVQLQVWKDLAISKQILMGAATDALGLDAECSTDELKQALNQAIARARDADTNIQNTRGEAERQVAEATERAQVAVQARSEAEARAEEAEKARAQAEHQLAIGKEDNAKALKKARAEVADREKRLKEISKALADTPENVVRKLKTLKKQKMDETKLRTQAETKLQKARKESSRLEAEVESQKALLATAGKLIEQVRALHQACEQADATIAKLSDDQKHRVEIPAIDEAELENLEAALAEK